MSDPAKNMDCSPPGWLGLGLVPFDVLRVTLGLILLFAAALKGWQLATEPVLGQGVLGSRWFLCAEVEMELLLSFWLLSGLFKRPAWWAAISCFAVFAGITLWKVLSRETSCGCFGKIEIHPAYTLGFDVAALVLLLVFRPTETSARVSEGIHLHQRHWMKWASGATALASMLTVSVVGINGYRPAGLNEAGGIVGDDQFVVLEPENWVSKRLPLLNYIEIDAQLELGTWFLLLYRHDCSDCQLAIRKYLNMAWDLQTAEPPLQIALIEVASLGSVSPEGISPAACKWGRLATNRQWIVTTPVNMFLREGMVQSVSGEPLNPLTVHEHS